MSIASLPPLRPHQERGLHDLREALAGGGRRLCVTSPTGGGKSRMMYELAHEYGSSGRNVVMLTNRRLVTDQSSRGLEEAGVQHGILSAGFLEQDANVQVASIQTLHSRCIKRTYWELPPADLVLLDEAHLETAERSREILGRYWDASVPVVGWTATPVGIGGLYDELIVAGTVTELIAAGSLVPCKTFAPDEPDLTHVKRGADGEFVNEDVVKRVMVCEETGAKRPRIFGRVYEHLLKLNPFLEPTLLFAPDVQSSMGFAEDLTARGVPAAHMDAKTPMDKRKEIIEQHRRGDICVVCSRWVLREGVDLPYVRHVILATAFGAPSTYIQVGGRGLRAFPGKPYVTIQDHGGHWWRDGFGPLDADREWGLGETDNDIRAKARKQRELKGDTAEEEICCPQCGKTRKSGPVCPHCGYQHQRSVRHVIQTNGTLKSMQGRAHKIKPQKPQEQKDAENILWACIKSGRTVAQLEGMYWARFGRNWPDGVATFKGRGVVLPSRASIDWDSRVKDWLEKRWR